MMAGPPLDKFGAAPPRTINRIGQGDFFPGRDCSQPFSARRTFSVAGSCVKGGSGSALRGLVRGIS